MRDMGRSDDPRVQAQLDRLAALSLPQGRLGLETITAMMERLGNPHRKLPPVFHVAGTNGKGSVCAFLRAMLEADGKRVHVTTSPHLVRYNERIRIAGELISDEALAPLLEEVLDHCEDLGPSFFEVTIAAAFLAFSRTPADACVVEVGLGGRFDATNVLEPEALAACGIAALGLDHEHFLLAPEEGVPTKPMARIAFEKAGIAKKGVPLVTMRDHDYPLAALEQLKISAEKAGALFFNSWGAKPVGDDRRIAYGESQAAYFHTIGAPALIGRHQVPNAGLAIAMLRHQQKVPVSQEAMQKGPARTKWPARMQRMGQGPLTGKREVWLDGGHNPSAGEAIAAALKDRFHNPFQGPLHLIIGMIDNKNPRALLDPLSDNLRSVSVVPVPGYDSHPVELFGQGAVERADLMDAMLNIPNDGHPVLIAGSLYLAGEALRLNDEVPD